jgi:3-deoxy-manno-octulosonate cytidylyltransferase (CMP-KDO synthetase)
MTDRFVIIVPARAASTRLPNKPMMPIHGRSLISRIIDLAQSSNAINSYIATDSIEIKNHAESLGANVVMTSDKHASGMDRIAEAAKKIDLPLDTLILNLQGDEPFMPLQIINKLPMLVSKDAPITTACVSFNENMDRSVIPNSFTFDYKNYLKHLGIYAYTNETLQALSKLDQTENEETERLEQLRFLDNGFNIYVEDFEFDAPIGIDTPDDLEAAIAFAKEMTDDAN